jgi:rhodanese-related sulfurtransferase
MARTPHPDRLADVDPQQAVAMLERGEATLLDVREPQEWSAGHAPQAEHLPLGELDAGAIQPGGPVIAVCRSGNRSGKAADLLAAAGVPVHNLAGGMKGWVQAGYPVVTDAGKPGTVA